MELGKPLPFIAEIVPIPPVTPLVAVTATGASSCLPFRREVIIAAPRLPLFGLIRVAVTRWVRGADSNRRSPTYEDGELTTSLPRNILAVVTV